MDVRYRESFLRDLKKLKNHTLYGRIFTLAVQWTADGDRSRFPAWLLRTTLWRVGDIVVFVGYVDMSSFVRLFRQWCDMKPSDFRERVREAEQQAGAIPRDVFAWHLWQRFWDRELSVGEARELLAYFEKLYLAPPA